MKKLTYLVFYSVLLMFAVGCTGHKGEKQEVLEGDTIHTRTEALKYMANEPDKALEIIDSAVMVGNMTSLRADMLRAVVYSRTYEDIKYDSAIIIGERLMRHDSVMADPDLQAEILEVLLNACRMKKENDQALQWAIQLGEIYRSRGEETEALRNDAEIGMFLIRIGQQEEGLAQIDSVIQQLDGKRKFNELDASIIALKRKAEICSEIGLCDEMIDAAQRILDVLDDYEQNYEEFRDNSVREPADEDIPFYIDFYRGKAYAYMAEANASLGDKKKARAYYALYEQTYAGQGLTGRFMVAPALGKIGEYDRMLAIYDEVEQQIGDDTLNANYAEVLHGRAEAAEAQGRYKDACGYWRRHVTLIEIIDDQLLRSKAHLFAARFHAQEQQREIEHNREIVRRAKLIGTALSIGVLLVLLFAIYAVIEWRRTKTRNRILAFQITEALKYKEKYRELTQPQPVTPADDYADMSDADLFAYLRDVIECENLYLNPDFDRQTLINRTGVSKERIATAFAQGSEHESLNTFVRELRLDYAVRLMNEKPSMSIEQVSKASGFAKVDTFERNFKVKYGMTPMAYQQTKA